MSVKSDLDKAFNKKVIKLTEQVTRKTAFDLQADLSLQTPVDTGRARANWLPSLNQPRADTVSAGAEVDTNAATIGYKIDGTIFIANNLPYIQRLNNGWSSQNATPSWVEGSVKKFKRRMKKAIAQVKRGL